LLTPEEQFAARTRLHDLVAEIRSTEGAQVLTFAMVSPKADIGFMLLCADLHKANELEKRLTAVLGPDVLSPTFSYLSMTERSEYTTSEADYSASLVAEDGLAVGT